MRAPRKPWTPQAPPPGRSVPQSNDNEEERQARVAEMMAHAQRHTAKTTLPHPEAERVAALCVMLDGLISEYGAAQDVPERAAHLADAILDLEMIILRTMLVASPTTRAIAMQTVFHQLHGRHQ